VADAITELLITEAALEKLGKRGISVEETEQLVDNRYTILRQRRRGRQTGRPPPARRMVVGRTSGGRALTLVVERTVDPTTWLVITGWEATSRERRILGK
jgi:uncharacterized DUF497 family protein